MVVFETIRLCFRLMRDNDIDLLKTLDTDPHVRAFFPTRILTDEQIKTMIKDNQLCFNTRGFCDFIIEHKDNGTFLGRGGLNPYENDEIEVGYVFLENAWGQGYATEALNGILSWAFSNIDPCHIPHGRIIGFAPMDHKASQKVLEKCGMTPYKTDTYHGIPCQFYEFRNPRQKTLPSV